MYPLLIVRRELNNLFITFQKIGKHSGGECLSVVHLEVPQVVEGVETSISARDLAMSQGVEMPIVAQVHAVLHEGRPPREAISDLMSRRLRGEVPTVCYRPVSVAVEDSPPAGAVAHDLKLTTRG